MLMAKYKVLKSVAHNIGHSFTSLMNYAGDDYVMGHILRLARRTGCDTLTIDFVKREAAPSELLAAPISEVPANYTKRFWDLIQRQGSDPSLVKSASLVLRYNLGVQLPHPRIPEFKESPYACDVQITDDRGKEHVARFRGWWYPERLDNPQKDSRPWWKFWNNRGGLFLT
jgi:hypothetical protein